MYPGTDAEKRGERGPGARGVSTMREIELILQHGLIARMPP